MGNENRTDAGVLLGMARRKLCQDAIDNDRMAPPFTIVTTNGRGKVTFEHRVAVDADGEFIETEVRGLAEGGMQEPFDLELTDAQKKTKTRELNFI